MTGGTPNLVPRKVKITTGPTDNAIRQRAALKAMSSGEQVTGVSDEAWARFHADQRERVRARLGAKS